jgi:Family of unknown function (DUF6932)
MSDLVARFVEACRATNAQAAALDYPPFTSGLRTETPLNSAPFLFDMSDFRQAFGTSDRRLEILKSCDKALTYLCAHGVRWRMLLAGGSFVRPGCVPSDLDGLLIYTVDPHRSAEADSGLRAFAATMRGERIDLRFCPADADPIVLVKRSIFFSNLFSYDRRRDALVHGTVIVIPDRAESGR